MGEDGRLEADIPARGTNRAAQPSVLGIAGEPDRDFRGLGNSGDKEGLGVNAGDQRPLVLDRLLRPDGLGDVPVLSDEATFQADGVLRDPLHSGERVLRYFHSGIESSGLHFSSPCPVPGVKVRSFRVSGTCSGWTARVSSPS